MPNQFKLNITSNPTPPFTFSPPIHLHSSRLSPFVPSSAVGDGRQGDLNRHLRGQRITECGEGHELARRGEQQATAILPKN